MKKTNFHTHTYRCGHANGTEEDMVQAAIHIFKTVTPPIPESNIPIGCFIFFS